MSGEHRNSLARAASAYLRSAMHQPVNWMEWGDEAFALAEKEDKPILLDIGAVWCHWCHVMDRESYEDAATARLINEHFVAVKVDRDERPDVDTRYQAAVSAISGQGGWPLTAFLNTGGKPYFGGTYFPPEDRHGRPSFQRVLLTMAEAFENRRTEVDESAGSVMDAIELNESFSGRAGSPGPELVEKMVLAALKSVDTRHGGFGGQPKFPHSSAVDLLIDVASRSVTTTVKLTGQGTVTVPEAAKRAVLLTLDKMAKGGIYDHLAGGFHRYSVDERWVVPHFEKMSYDNSELLKNYVHAYQATGNEFFADVAKDIIRWMDEWLSDRELGGFYASQDADDSMDDDGDYFTWTREEARAVLDPQEAEVACLHYDINEIGEMHHNPAKNVLYQRAPEQEIALRLKFEVAKVAELLASAKRKLYATRLLRRTPYVDKTVYTGWNGLCISAYFEAAKVLNLKPAQAFALRSLERVLAAAVKPDGSLLHVIAYSDPTAEHREVTGLLEDYAFLSGACLDEYEATGRLRYFTAAQAIAEAMVAKFFDPVGGGFFDSENPVSALGVLGARRKPFQDSPTPAGNPAAAIVLSRLHAFTHETSYQDKAEGTLELLAAVAGRYGIFAGTYGLAAVHFAYPATQVVIVGEGDSAQQLSDAAHSGYAIQRSVVRLRIEDVSPQNLPPALAETIPSLPDLGSGKAMALVCTGFACQSPTSDPEVLRGLL